MCPRFLVEKRNTQRHTTTGIDNTDFCQKIPVCKLDNLRNDSNKKIYAAHQISCTLKKYDDLDLCGDVKL